MTDKKNESTDLLGLAPYGDALNTAVAKTFQGVEGFLKSVCMPALGEVGLMLKDQVRHWRLNNILKILEKAKGKIEFTNETLQVKAHPRVALSIIENGSVIDNDEVQDLWAGLFSSSCSLDGQDDENLIFVDILKQLTTAEAKIIKHACENSRKIVYENGLILSDNIEAHCDKLIELTGIKDIHRLDRELDHLRSLDLFQTTFLGGGGFYAGDKLVANIRPSALSLHLYMRTQGFTGSPLHFWSKQLITIAELELEQEKKQQEEELLNKMEEEEIKRGKVTE